MKKIFPNQIATVFNSRILLLIFLSFMLVQCKKNQTISEVVPLAPEKSVLLKDLTREVLSLAKDKRFKQLVYDECKAQKFGDYYVRMEDLLKNPNAKISISSEKASALTKLINQLKELGARNPIIFYPSVETREDKKNSSINTRAPMLEAPGENVIAVINVDNIIGGGLTNDEYPGYTFNTDGQLGFTQQINEEFAWNNDVWVIGEEENCGEGNMIAAPEEFTLNPVPARFQGQREFGAIIQFIDNKALKTIEPWISGKIEFKYTVFNSTGTKILGTLELGKVKRKYFQDSKWYDYNKSIGSWNTSAFGDYMYEHWLEDDGGFSQPKTATLPSQTGATGISYTVSIPAKNRDDDMGVTVIQFTDQITQIYDVSYARVKRKN